MQQIAGRYVGRCGSKERNDLYNCLPSWWKWNFFNGQISFCRKLELGYIVGCVWWAKQVSVFEMTTAVCGMNHNRKRNLVGGCSYWQYKWASVKWLWGWFSRISYLHSDSEAEPKWLSLLSLRQDSVKIGWLCTADSFIKYVDIHYYFNWINHKSCQMTPTIF